MKNNLSYFNARCLFSGIGYSYILNLTGCYFYVSWFLGSILGVLLLVLFPKDIGKVSKNIVSFSLATITLSLLINMSYTLYLDNTPVILISLFTFFGAFTISTIKNSSLVRLSHILFIISISLFLLKIIGLVPALNPTFLESTPQYKNIFIASCFYALVSTIPIISLNNLNQRKEIVTNYVISSVTVFGILFLIVNVLGVKESMLYRYPEYVILRRIQFSNFISNVENVFNLAIIIDLLITSSLSIKNISVKNKYLKAGIYFFLFIVVYLTCYFYKPLMFIYSYLGIILFICFIILLVGYKFKKSEYDSKERINL